MKTIKGTVVYKNIGPGCWGIIDGKGGEWHPVSMPIQLQKEGRVAIVRVKLVEEGFSLFMWGTPVEVIGFNT
ncbi:MAG: hypothetical protein ACI9VN_003206 [Patescibacteria group bacterium]|jgi:hypothetical protein